VKFKGATAAMPGVRQLVATRAVATARVGPARDRTLRAATMGAELSCCHHAPTKRPLDARALGGLRQRRHVDALFKIQGELPGPSGRAGQGGTFQTFTTQQLPQNRPKNPSPKTYPGLRFRVNRVCGVCVCVCGVVWLCFCAFGVASSMPMAVVDTERVVVRAQPTRPPSGPCPLHPGCGLSRPLGMPLHHPPCGKGPRAALLHKLGFRSP
jgi:hypothetical protein